MSDRLFYVQISIDEVGQNVRVLLSFSIKKKCKDSR